MLRFPLSRAFPVLFGLALFVPTAAEAAANCPVDHDQLQHALKASVKPSGGPSNGGFDNNEWAAVVNRQGQLCAIAFSGDKPDSQWPGSRAVAMEKANTANGFSTSKMAVSTANLFASAQPGQELYGALATNPPSADIGSGDPTQFGSAADPMLGKSVGGVVVFGGGLALYDGNDIVGGLGLSGDSSCADHNIAWRVRKALSLDKVPAGLDPQTKDGIIYDVGVDGKSASGFGHVTCRNNAPKIAEEIGAGHQFVGQ